MSQSSVMVRRITAPAETAAMRDLRGRVLRPGLPRDATRYPGDADPAAIHLGAFVGRQCVGVASLYREQGLRLRGMAVDPAWQRRGIGAALIRQAQQIAAASALDLWCHARDAAAGFYAGLGWVAEGAGFDVPESGAHHVMRWRVEDESGTL